MDLLLNNILNLTPSEIANSKIEFNMRAGSGGQQFLDRWLKHTEYEKATGTCADCSYWGWYGKQHNFYPGQWVFSFARITDDEWLFISAAEIVEVTKEWAKVSILDRFAPFFGRLIIKYKKGNKFSRYVFNLSTCLAQITVKEVRSCMYRGGILKVMTGFICHITDWMIFLMARFFRHIMKHSKRLRVYIV